MKTTIIFPEETGLSPIDLNLTYVPDVFCFNNICSNPEQEYKYTNRYWKVRLNLVSISVSFKNDEQKKELFKRELQSSVATARLKYPHVQDQDILSVAEVENDPVFSTRELYVVPYENPFPLR